MSDTRKVNPGETTTIPLEMLTTGEQVRDTSASSEEELEVRLKIDDLERSMWVDLSRGLPFWSTLVVQPVRGSGERFVIVDGERRFRALRRLQSHFDRELNSSDWTDDEKKNIRNHMESRRSVPCRIVAVEGAQRKGLQFRANKSLALTTAELKEVYTSLFRSLFVKVKGRPYEADLEVTEEEAARIWRLVAQETGERPTKVTAIGSLDQFRDAGGNSAELARRALLDKSDPDAIDFSWVEGINTMFKERDWDAIAGKVIRGEVRSVATKGGLRDYAKYIYAPESTDQTVTKLARKGLLEIPGFAPHHADALSFLGGEFASSNGEDLLRLFSGRSSEETKSLARHLLQQRGATVGEHQPTTEDYHDELVALLYRTGAKMDARFAEFVPRDFRFRQLVQTLGAFQIKLNEFIEALKRSQQSETSPAGEAVQATTTRMIADANKKS